MGALTDRAGSRTQEMKWAVVGRCFQAAQQLQTIANNRKLPSMAWQLIYTSAPRLLEAGRTGFGTVARHRGVGELVAGAVERVSQFARLPGLGARRVIHSHRILTVGASQVHVFSCIRDAGSDYTGRTNHIAHHLIAEAREVQAAIDAGITPADVLSQMKWRLAWNEPPRFFEPAEEIPLTSLRARAFGSAWERLTGRADLSALPRQTPRCFVILPGETEALPLFQESLSSMGTQAMQVTFTTHLEPTDDPAEFRWVALNASSPLRQQADGSARTVLDLTQPQTWPKLGTTVSSAPARTSRESFTPVQVAARPVPETSLAAQASLPGSYMEPRHPASPKRGRSWWPITIATGLAACILWVLFVLGNPWAAANKPNISQTATSLAKRVDDLWQKHHLLLPVTATWLKSQADAVLIDSHEKALQQLAQAIREPLHAIDIPRPESTQDEFMEMLQSFSKWQKSISESVRQETWSRDNPAEIKLEARVRLDAEERQWKSFAKNFTRAPSNTDPLKLEISTQALKQLNKSAPPTGSAEDWRDVITMTTSPSPSWLEHWVSISRLASDSADLSASDRKALGEIAGNKTAPSWLQQLASKQLSQISEIATTEAAARKAAENMLKPAAPEIKVLSADGPASSHARYIIIERAETDFTKLLAKLPSLPVQDEMQIIAGSAGFAESNLIRWRPLGAPGVYRKSFTDSATLEFKEGRLVKAPSDKDSWRIISRSASGTEVLFEVILLAREKAPTEVWHSDPTFTFQNLHQSQRTTLDEAAARWLSQISFIGTQPLLRLQSLEDPARRFRVRLDGSAAVVEIETKQQQLSANNTRISKLGEEMATLKEGIRIDQQRKKEVTEGNLARREKEEILTRFDTTISNKELRILEMEEELRSLTATTATPNSLVGIPAGRYVLAAVVYSQDGSENACRLCELTISSQPAKNAP